MPEVQERNIRTESVKSTGETKAIKCDKCNRVMRFMNELTVYTKKVGLRLVAFLVCFLLQRFR